MGPSLARACRGPQHDALTGGSDWHRDAGGVTVAHAGSRDRGPSVLESLSGSAATARCGPPAGPRGPGSGPGRAAAAIMIIPAMIIMIMASVITGVPAARRRRGVTGGHGTVIDGTGRGGSLRLSLSLRPGRRLNGRPPAGGPAIGRPGVH